VDENFEKFLTEFRQSLTDETFVKMTLGNYKGSEEHLQKIFVRPIGTKKGERLFFQYRYDTRDTVKGFDFGEGADQIKQRLESGFRNAHLFTTSCDFQLDIGKRSSRLNKGKPTFKTRPQLSHDRKKQHLVDQNAYYLRALGITTDSGEIRAQQYDKWKQINKFIEILAGLVQKSSLKDKENLTIVDMGCGKGYLTFAAFDHFKNTLGRDVTMTGVDTKREIVALCNDVVHAGGLNGLKFVCSSIVDFDVGGADILIALHACDTATDDVIFKGISARSEIIVTAPCCHKEVRPQIKPPEIFADILKHGVILDRAAETITDGMRSLLLECNGYTTRIFEFISVEHTPKNNLIVGIKTGKPADINNLDRQIRDVKALFGIVHQHLESLLA
jgi:SAM-dependent methyltransferase